MLGKVSEKMYAIQGGPFFIKNTPWTCKGKYSGVNSTYKIGCNDCTGMGHIEGNCDNNNKRGPPSGGDSPQVKKR